MIRDVHSSNRRKKRKALRSRCWLNGEEVTHRCFYADDRRGIVRLYLHNDEGRAYIVSHNPLRVATEERRGKVRLGRV